MPGPPPLRPRGPGTPLSRRCAARCRPARPEGRLARPAPPLCAARGRPPGEDAAATRRFLLPVLGGGSARAGPTRGGRGPMPGHPARPARGGAPRLPEPARGEARAGTPVGRGGAAVGPVRTRTQPRPPRSHWALGRLPRAIGPGRRAVGQWTRRSWRAARRGRGRRRGPSGNARLRSGSGRREPAIEAAPPRLRSGPVHGAAVWPTGRPRAARAGGAHARCRGVTAAPAASGRPSPCSRASQSHEPTPADSSGVPEGRRGWGWR